MTDLVPPDLIPQWIPGESTLDSSHMAWRGLCLKGYRYDHLEVEIPQMRDYMIVLYRGTPVTMRRNSGGPWEEERVEAGVISLLTRAEQSIWRWDDDLDVRHIYLSHEALAATAEQVFEFEPERIDVGDVVRSEDAVLPACLGMLESELAVGGPGHNLLVDAMKTQIAIHVLRRYARLKWRERSAGGFDEADRRRLVEFIDSHLSDGFGLEQLAASVGLSAFHFSRKFKVEFGMTPHAFVTRKKVERAKDLLRRRKLPIKAIASECGFADQSHLSRTFRSAVGVTPKTFQRECW